MARAKNTKLLANFDCPGGGQVWVDGHILYIGHMRQPTGTTIVDVADPRHPKVLARVDLPPGWHSHKVRVANDIMVVNHERQGQDGDPAFGGGLGIYDVSKPGAPEAHQQMAHPWQGRAPLRFRRPLRLYLADGRRLYRQYRHDPRPQGSGPAGGGRALVDSGAMAGGRRGLSLGQLDAAALPSPDAHGRPALCQLLASRLLHPRHRRYVEAEADLRRQYLARLPASHPYLPADAQAPEGPRDHGGGR